MPSTTQSPDRYARFLRDELLAEVQSKYNIRKDAYSRAITGLSSGGICALNVAWWQPDQFSRVLSWIGSYGSIQWQPGVLDGGDIYPFKVRKEEKRNIRVWLQDGEMDVEGPHGSWPLQNIQLANSLKFREYDFHFSYGQGNHNSAHGSSELSRIGRVALARLRSGQDRAGISDGGLEKAKLFTRVRIANR